MGKDYTKQGVNRNFILYIKAFVIEVIITALCIAAFAFIMFLFEAGYNYASVFATVSIAVGCFFGTAYAARHIGNRGYLTGMIIGGITFLLITLISFIYGGSGFTYNTLFHLIIIFLSAVIGGIFGVNRRNNRKYI